VTSTDTIHRRLCHDLFDALERGDVAGVDACYAPGMTMWWNVTGATTTREENLEAITKGAEIQRRRTYNDRQIRTFDDGFLAQYSLTVVGLNGAKRTLWACLVGEVRDGKITKLMEYLDAGKFR
jgi:ketosteroid isomerase-like protein